MQVLDMTGKACPIPVIEAKKILEGLSADAQLTVLVDNAVAVENLKKLAAQRGDQTADEQRSPQVYAVTFTVGDAVAEGAQPATGDAQKTLVVIASDVMGHGAPELGQTLMKGFVYALTELNPLPDTVLMYNAGAKLSVNGSPVLEHLQQLEARGVTVLTCGTCLNFYELTDQLAVGQVTNMYTIVEAMAQADRVIRPS